MKEVDKQTEDLVLGSQIFVLEKLRDDLLGTFNITKFDAGDKNIENYTVKVGNILFVINSMINRLGEQRDKL